MDDLPYLEFLGNTVLVMWGKDGTCVGTVLRTNRKYLLVQPYRIPMGISLDEQHDLGYDFHLAPVDRTQIVPLNEITGIERVTVNPIVSSRFSHSSIDALGVRMRCGSMTREDLRLLDSWRREYRPAYRLTVSALEGSFGYRATGRPAKTTGAIREKLIRATVRLSQMQDIAGCRIIVNDMFEQDRAVQQITSLFNETQVFDRREKPSHGYRAVHIVATIEGRPVEIQVRTLLQHRWAEVSQKLADVLDSEIKYGKGNHSILKVLRRLSRLSAQIESGGLDASSSQREEALKLMALVTKLAETL